MKTNIRTHALKTGSETGWIECTTYQ